MYGLTGRPIHRVLSNRPFPTVGSGKARLTTLVFIASIGWTLGKLWGFVMVYMVAVFAVSFSVAGDFLTSEEIVFVEDAPPAIRAIDHRYKVGYYFKSFAGLVNYDGDFVLYHNEINVEYLQLTDSEWRALLGDEAAAVYEVPFKYRWPIGWFVLGGLVVVVGGLVLRTKIKAKRTSTDPLSLDNVKADERIAAGMSHYIQACARTGLSPYAENSELYLDSVQHLVDEHGVARDYAVNGLSAMIEYMAVRAAAEQQEAAARLEESESYEEALGAYEAAAELFDRSDPAHAAFVRRECVGRVQKRIDQLV